ncbi:Nif3-like dinuclear metal center hexameric protein [Clostridium algidicarnis]|uniref:Nif3-like dinuclear metal center hexameric protein n=1 Tax=Clostridium algidicarnis TaxID=37659 RepID=UPI001C0E4EF2|nr:Nif3-like dinuclear metal center hexameric protein [Clostridium algidicarnis]MBU3195762.1 Nif3-like dinuclear metal center hexameric protein [Clostridium algidicarnis]MBU3208784.1 Nif3-like dinuclear metal center hexameric protein [Clostridium algidicarnis]
MIVQDIVDYMEVIAPVELKESYDNVGLMIGNKKDQVKSILFCLDCNLEVINEAKLKCVDMIISHHPLLFKKPSSITTETLQGKKIIELIKADINLYSSHTNLDSVKNGMNDTMIKLLDLNIKDAYIIDKSSSIIEKAGIGRIIELTTSITAKELCSTVKEKFQLKNIRFVGDLNNKITKIALINGSGQDYFELARNLGAQCIITSDTTYHFVSEYKEMGLFIIDVGHFSCEQPLFKIIYKNIEDHINLKDPTVKMFFSEAEKEPYEIF